MPQNSASHSPHSVSPPSHILSAPSMNSLQLCNITNARSYKVCIFQMSALSSRLLTPCAEIMRLRHCASHHQHLCTTATAVHSQSAHTALDFLPHLPRTHIHPLFNLPCAPGRTHKLDILERSYVPDLPLYLSPALTIFSRRKPYFGIDILFWCTSAASAAHLSTHGV